MYKHMGTTGLRAIFLIRILYFSIRIFVGVEIRYACLYNVIDRLGNRL